MFPASGSSNSNSSSSSFPPGIAEISHSISSEEPKQAQTTFNLDESEKTNAPKPPARKRGRGRPSKSNPSTPDNSDGEPTPAAPAPEQPKGFFQKLFSPPEPEPQAPAPAPSKPKAKSAGKSPSFPVQTVPVRASLIRKIKTHFKKPLLRELISDITEPDARFYDRATQEELDELMAEINFQKTSHFREQYVKMAFSFGAAGIEATLNAMIDGVQWKTQGSVPGLKDMMMRSEEFFEPELSELESEISDSLIPDAKYRMAFKVFNFVMGFYHARSISGPPNPKASQKREDDHGSESDEEEGEKGKEK